MRNSLSISQCAKGKCSVRAAPFAAAASSSLPRTAPQKGSAQSVRHSSTEMPHTLKLSSPRLLPHENIRNGLDGPFWHERASDDPGQSEDSGQRLRGRGTPQPVSTPERKTRAQVPRRFSSCPHLVRARSPRCGGMRQVGQRQITPAAAPAKRMHLGTALAIHQHVTGRLICPHECTCDPKQKSRKLIHVIAAFVLKQRQPA